MTQLTLPKGRDTFIIRYAPGSEHQVLDHLIAMVKDGRLDWFDAGCLSHQIGQNMAKEIRAMTGKLLLNMPPQGQ
jgi:hypothetical protein